MRLQKSPASEPAAIHRAAADRQPLYRTRSNFPAQIILVSSKKSSQEMGQLTWIVNNLFTPGQNCDSFVFE